MCWYGADPGGIKSFGVAALLEDDGSFKTWLCSSTDEALARIIQPAGVGIDCPLWWSSGEGGGRLADRWLRKTYRIASGTVQSVNSLKGAVLVEGLMLAMMLRKAHPNVPITELHPKALLVALRLKDWKAFSESFVLDGPEPPTEHERDALIGAVAVREGSLGRWKLDLALHLGPSEIDPKAVWFGEVHYWWPAEMFGDEEAPKKPEDTCSRLSKTEGIYRHRRQDLPRVSSRIPKERVCLEWTRIGKLSTNICYLIRKHGHLLRRENTSQRVGRISESVIRRF